VKSFDKKTNGNSSSLVGKQVKKMTRGGQGGFYLHDDLLPSYSQGQVAYMVIEQKLTKTLKF
jgi:hypothetical protein